MFTVRTLQPKFTHAHSNTNTFAQKIRNGSSDNKNKKRELTPKGGASLITRLAEEMRMVIE